MQTLQIRQPYDDPAHPGNPSTAAARNVQIRHPGYSDDGNILLQFDAYDGDCGVHYQTAHTACAIISGNKWEGYFSTDVEGLKAVKPSTPDEILADGKYYFHVSEDEHYAIVLTFRDWPFPHHDLPPAWQGPPSASSTPTDLQAGRPRCSMTRSTVPLETAHIIPANNSDMKWWNDNSMSQYGAHSTTRNTIWFRADVHQVFDRKPRFAIVPKSNTLVAHFFRATENAVEAVRIYHNVPLQFLAEVRMEFLLARLAWTAFPHLEIFFSSGKRRNVSRIDEDGVRIVEEMDGDRCHQFYVRSLARSTSPRKRNIGQANPGDAGGGDDSYEYYDVEPPTEDDEEYQQRGRKRRRSSFTSRTSTSTSGRLGRSGSEISVSEHASLLAGLKT